MDRYSSKPWHLAWPSVLFLVGTLAVTYAGWFWFGMCLFLTGVAAVVWIVAAGMWDAYGAYWESVTEFASVMANNHNPQLWAALGFNPTTAVELTIPSQPITKTTQLFDLPASRTKLQTFADAVLMGRPMSEGEWSGKGKVFSLPEFRNLKHELERRKLITLSNPTAPQQGFVLTHKGRQLLLDLASQGIRDMLAPANQVDDGEPALLGVRSTV